MNEEAKSVIDTNIQEEACVLEILQELQSSFPNESEESLQISLIAQLALYADVEQLGFYLDELGAKDVSLISVDEGMELLNSEAAWDVNHEPKLHVFWRRD